MWARNTMRALITGVTGFVGSHLAEHLISVGDNVGGVSLSGRWPNELASLAAKVPTFACDATDQAGWERVLDEVRPDVVYHLAGMAHVGDCAQNPAEALRINRDGVSALTSAMLRRTPAARLLHVGTGAVYGAPSVDEMPLTERTTPSPVGAYANSKLEGDRVAREACEHGLWVAIARPFNHIGPRQKPTFAIARFAKQIADRERTGSAGKITVGALTVHRDFTDVKDVVRAYRLLVAHATKGETYLVASGVAYPLADLLGRLLRMSPAKIDVVQDPALLRANDAPMIRVDPSKLQSATAWRAEIPIDQTLRDTLEYFRAATHLSR